MSEHNLKLSSEARDTARKQFAQRKNIKVPAGKYARVPGESVARGEGRRTAKQLRRLKKYDPDIYHKETQ